MEEELRNANVGLENMLAKRSVATEDANNHLSEKLSRRQLVEYAKDFVEVFKSDRKFQGLLESAPDAMVIVNQQSQIDLVNAQTEKMFGYTRDELLDQPQEILFPKRFQKIHREHLACSFVRVVNGFLSGLGADTNVAGFR